MKNLGFWIYIIFTISWFTHLTARIHRLGAIRFDLLIVGGLFGLFFLSSSEEGSKSKSNKIERTLKTLIAYSIIVIPFVEWPGSVLRYGIPNFVKAVVFYFFTVKFLKTEKQLKIFIVVFLSCQSFRILEPLYLHVTEGYWGSVAGMANWELLNRLSGAPSDVVNPNGLAFIIVTVLPFLFCYATIYKKVFVLSILVAPLFLWTMILTASRSGIIALMAIVAFFTFKSRHKIFIILTAIIVACVASQNMTPDQKDRYLSIVSAHTKNAATAEGRVEGVIRNLHTAMRRPLFGHGLGTSLEVNANFGKRAQPAHNLYAEILEELGFIGLFIYIGYIYSVAQEIRKAQKLRAMSRNKESPFIMVTWRALWIFFFTNLIFSIASYGLSSYEWYLIPGLVCVLKKIETLSLRSIPR